jgi:hypothetical protein
MKPPSCRAVRVLPGLGSDNDLSRSRLHQYRTLSAWLPSAFRLGISGSTGRSPAGRNASEVLIPVRLKKGRQLQRNKLRFGDNEVFGVLSEAPGKPRD